MLVVQHQALDFCTKQHNNMVFHPVAPFWSFEGWILLRISLKMAVRSFWSDLEKFPKSASGEILKGGFCSEFR